MHRYSQSNQRHGETVLKAVKGQQRVIFKARKPAAKKVGKRMRKRQELALQLASDCGLMPKGVTLESIAPQKLDALMAFCGRWLDAARGKHWGAKTYAPRAPSAPAAPPKDPRQFDIFGHGCGVPLSLFETVAANENNARQQNAKL